MPNDPTWTICQLPGEGALVYEPRKPGCILVRDAQGVDRVVIADDRVEEVVAFLGSHLRYHSRGREGA